MTKENEDSLIDDIFHDFIKMTKILYDSVQDKFKINNKAHHDRISAIFEETELSLKSNDLSVKERI